MLHIGPRVHAFVNGLFRPSDEQETRALYERVRRLFEEHGLDREDAQADLAVAIARQSIGAETGGNSRARYEALADLTLAAFDYEDMFVLPDIDWTERRSVSEWWELKDRLLAQKALFDDLDRTIDLTKALFGFCRTTVDDALPDVFGTKAGGGDIVAPSKRLDLVSELPSVVERILAGTFDERIERAELFPRLRTRLERNLVAASGGNPADVKGFTRTPRLPTRSDIVNRGELVATYLGGTPLAELFDGALDFVIPQSARFEHTHIVAGSGHGKTQTLQYLIANDLPAVARGEASVVVIDSQGDMIRQIASLKLFAQGEPLHERICLIDPSDIEYPVSLNLFDVGLDRFDRYSELDRERLTNSILELYDFVLGSLLSAEMTQKQSVIFRYVTRLMLHIPDATIHTLRELMEPDSEVRFADDIAKLGGTARKFFDTEFGSSEFRQTRKQVLRRLWGILENQTFERMFSHPRSKLDLFAEMNAGNVILINTTKDLLKESGTEIFGRFFIALIAQAAQERAVLPEGKRLPTFVYIDEAADYFDRNIGLILSQARKYRIGMVLAHQYLGQLDPKLQEAFAANTAIKLAGGVSNKDARALAPMLATEPASIEAQPKGSFATYVRGLTKSAVPLSFPFGHLDTLPTMTPDERAALTTAMRQRYAVHYTEIDGGEGSGAAETGGRNGNTLEEAEPESRTRVVAGQSRSTDEADAPNPPVRQGDRKAGKAGQRGSNPSDPDDGDTEPSPTW